MNPLINQRLNDRLFSFWFLGRDNEYQTKTKASPAKYLLFRIYLFKYKLIVVKLQNRSRLDAATADLSFFQWLPIFLRHTRVRIQYGLAWAMTKLVRPLRHNGSIALWILPRLPYQHWSFTPRSALETGRRSEQLKSIAFDLGWDVLINIYDRIIFIRQAFNILVNMGSTRSNFNHLTRHPALNRILSRMVPLKTESCKRYLTWPRKLSAASRYCARQIRYCPIHIVKTIDQVHNGRLARSLNIPTNIILPLAEMVIPFKTPTDISRNPLRFHSTPSVVCKGWCILRGALPQAHQIFPESDPGTSESQLHFPACRNLNDRLIVLLEKSKGWIRPMATEVSH